MTSDYHKRSRKTGGRKPRVGGRRGSARWWRPAQDKSHGDIRLRRPGAGGLGGLGHKFAGDWGAVMGHAKIILSLQKTVGGGTLDGLDQPEQGDRAAQIGGGVAIGDLIGRAGADDPLAGALGSLRQAAAGEGR